MSLTIYLDKESPSFDDSMPLTEKYFLVNILGTVKELSMVPIDEPEFGQPGFVKQPNFDVHIGGFELARNLVLINLDFPIRSQRKYKRIGFSRIKRRR